MGPYLRSLVWFRRDLRDFDHAALYHALKSSQAVYCSFIFDTEILDKLTNKADRRVEFIWESVRELKQALQAKGGDLIVQHGKAAELIPALAQQLGAGAVFTNRDYEPAAVKRDTQVASLLSQQEIAFHGFKDQVIFEKDEVLSQAGKPYTVFTPYKNAHLKKLTEDHQGFYLQPYPVYRYVQHLAQTPPTPLMALEQLGFQRTNLHTLPLPTGMSGGKTLFEDFESRMSQYKDARDYPAVKGVSYLSVHLRFGTVSIRYLARQAANRTDTGSQAWLNELVWRDFYFQILYHHPQVAEGKAFKPEYEHIPFLNDIALFQAWCDGKTGYPIVDAAMRQLNQTGWMHNRLRMVTASFLVKDLLVDWRWGERYFAEKLIDFDLSANNGGWQWAASTGCDAQPYFRIFNPTSQSEKFDPQGKFIRKYVPELALLDSKEIHAPWQIPSLRQRKIGFIVENDYFLPIVDHATQRHSALDLYKKSITY
ncbi:MAG TPA: deoxyribodipyrimidine photo-lyase [Methylophilus sp.]|nr:deoxyribodipyrimidine photo-lyase [Methylophilus sp.]HQQ33165.1 deoxyribodipyrimidine photo-lyase [Methylophilus sp.]